MTNLHHTMERFGWKPHTVPLCGNRWRARVAPVGAFGLGLLLELDPEATPADIAAALTALQSYMREPVKS